MGPSDAVALVAGGFVVVATWAGVLRTLVVPRAQASVLTTGVDRVIRTGFVAVSDRFHRLETRDGILAVQGPVTLLVLLSAWLFLFVGGFALVGYGATDASMSEALRESGSSLFTLGYAAPRPGAGTLVSYLAAASGLVVVALQVGYLPTLYAAFNRRETLVTLLQSRAGSPAWGPEVLARHHQVAIVDSLRTFYVDWERWAADLAESHSNYPVLVRFRSPDALRSWIVALLAVLDSAALYLATCPKSAPSEARLCLRMGFVALRDICRVTGVPFDPDPWPDAPIELTYHDFLDGIARLDMAKFPMERTPEEAWPHFRGWRVNYEPLCYALARELDAVPVLWSGPRRRERRQIAPQAPPNRQPETPDRY